MHLDRFLAGDEYLVTNFRENTVYTYIRIMQFIALQLSVMDVICIHIIIPLYQLRIAKVCIQHAQRQSLASQESMQLHSVLN